MKQLWLLLTIRVVAIGGVVLAVVAWLQQHLAPIELEHALVALVFLGYLAFWVTQGRRR